MELIRKAKVLEQLDQGCFRITIDEEQYQLDVLKKTIILGNKQYQQLRKWIEIQYHINHPNIQKLFFYCHDKENVYIVREYMGGGCLSNRIRYGSLNIDFLKSILTELFSIKDYFQQKHLTLDLKIDNIFLDQQNHIKLSNLNLIQHKRGQLFTNQTIGAILYQCAYGKQCRYDYQYQNEIIKKIPIFIEDQTQENNDIITLLTDLLK